eukprot:935752-Prorocentrum_minimum.AAC.2
MAGAKDRTAVPVASGFRSCCWKRKNERKTRTRFEEPGECGGMVSSLGWAKVASLRLCSDKHKCELPSNGGIVAEQSGVTCA